MNLKGATLANAPARCVSVLYNEEGVDELVGYRGVVVYAERTRCAPTSAHWLLRPSPP